MKLLVKRTPDNVITYNQSAKGLEVIQTVGSNEEAYDVVARLEDSDFFPQDDGVVLNYGGNEVYDPKYPNMWEMGDYTYYVEDVSDLDEYDDSEMIQALEEAGIEI